MTSTTPSSFERSWRTTGALADHQRAYRLLYAGFTLLPIVAGFDKFLNILVDWSKYLAPVADDALPMSASALMPLIGVVEIAAGLLVAARPRIGGYVVAGWLVAVVVNLALGGYWDIALRDVGLIIAALALVRLSPKRA